MFTCLFILIFCNSVFVTCQYRSTDVYDPHLLTPVIIFPHNKKLQKIKGISILSVSLGKKLYISLELLTETGCLSSLLISLPVFSYI